MAPNTSSPARLADRHALARQHRLIDGGAAIDDLAIDGDLLAGLDQQDVADLHIIDGDFLLRAVPHEARGLGAEVDQLLDGGARLPAASRLEVAPEQDERRNDGAGFEIEMLIAGTAAPRS